jgi:hypothetical protein
MASLAQAYPAENGTHPDDGVIKTTLLELINVVYDQLEPGEEHLVVPTVLHMLDSGQVRIEDDVKTMRRLSSLGETTVDVKLWNLLQPSADVGMALC